MADSKSEETEEQPADDATDDELEQDDAGEGAEAGGAKKKSKEQQENEAKNRKADSAKILAGGDFQVQIHVIEGRDLTGKDANGMSDPVVTISIFDEKKSTKIKNKTKNPRWDQVLYFELNKLEPDQLSQGKALIQVFDADILTRNDLIGAFEFDLSWIYYREHHEVYNQWIALTNPDADDEEEEEEKDDDEGIDGIEGYLKLSITILGPGDEQYIHDEEAELAKESSLESGMILVSPGIEQVVCNFAILQFVVDLFLKMKPFRIWNALKLFQTVKSVKSVNGFPLNGLLSILPNYNISKWQNGKMASDY